MLLGDPAFKAGDRQPHPARPRRRHRRHDRAGRVPRLRRRGLHHGPGPRRRRRPDRDAVALRKEHPAMEQVTSRIFAETKVRGCNPCFVKTSKGPVVIDTPQLPTKAVAMRGHGRGDRPDPVPDQHRAPRRPHLRQLLVQGPHDDRPPPGRPRAVHDRVPGAGSVRVRARGPAHGRPRRRRARPRPRDLLREHGHGRHRVHGRPDPQGGRPDVPPAPHSGPHARARWRCTSPRSEPCSPATRSSPSARRGS